MCTEQFIWYQDPTIWAAIIAGGSALITLIISGLFFWKKKRILASFQKDLDSNKEDLVRTTNELQERLRIEYSSVFTERLSVFKESIVRICKIEDIINQLASYDKYECKENLDYSENDCKSKSCEEKCIVHYWSVACQLRDYIFESHFFFRSNEMFLSITQIATYLQLFNDILQCSNDVYTIEMNNKLCPKAKALQIFTKFAELDKKINIENYRKDLVDSYRAIIKVPVYEKIRKI